MRKGFAIRVLILLKNLNLWRKCDDIFVELSAAFVETIIM